LNLKIEGRFNIITIVFRKCILTVHFLWFITDLYNFHAELKNENEFLKSKIIGKNQEVGIEEKLKALKLGDNNEELKFANKKKNKSGPNASQEQMLNYIKSYINRNKTNINKEDFKEFSDIKLSYNQLEKEERSVLIKNLLLSMKGPASEKLSKNYIKFYYFMNSFDDRKDFETELKVMIKRVGGIDHTKVIKIIELFYLIHKCCRKNSWKLSDIPPSYFKNINTEGFNEIISYLENIE
jgi:hypothetical protein